jgi:hypothetical protein
MNNNLVTLTLITMFFCTNICYGSSYILKQHNRYNCSVKTDSIKYYKAPIDICNRDNIVKVLDNGYCIAYFTNRQTSRELNKGTIINNNSWKYSTGFNKLKRSNIQITIAVHDVNTALTYLNNCGLGNSIVSTVANYITILCSTDDIIEYLEGNNNIYYIGQEANSPEPDSKIPDMNHYINRVHNAHIVYRDINGSGINISVKDMMFNKDDIDLLNKYIGSSIAAEETANHATNMATIIAGHGNSSEKGEGVAQMSKLSSSDYNNLTPDNKDYFTSNNVTVQNHSYGTKLESFYGSTAEMYDKFIYDNPTILHLFSAGNSGLKMSEIGKYKDIKNYATLTGNFKMAKNIIVVGAIDHNYNTPVFSSRGPAYDGRIKPDIVAYSTMGTSNSAALTSGVCALLQQQYKHTYGHLPNTATVKAVLINSANDVNRPGPDFMSGFGNIDAEDALNTITDNRIIEDVVNQSGYKTHKFTIPANCSELKATLSWIDVPSKPNSEIALINDLDIKITTPDGNTVLPWVLNSNATINDLTTNATRGTDRLNNNEQITINNPEQGEYTITVNAHNIATDNQNYSIAYQYTDTDNFKWISPVADSKYEYFKNGYSAIWEITYSNSSKGTLYAKVNNTNWQEIASDIDISKQLYRWNSEDDISGIAQLKMVISGNEYISDVFTINSDIALQTSLNCENDIELRWNNIDNAEGYKVYSINNSVMAEIQTTNSTTYRFKSDQYNSNYFTVAPIFNNTTGQRSRYTDTESSKNSCYINSFYAFESTNKNININLNLGSLYMVKKIDIYREDNTNRGVIKTITPTDFNMIIADVSPEKGNNTYHAVVHLTDNRTYTSDYSTVLHIPKNGYEVFPNPVSGNQINVYTDIRESINMSFKLYNLWGVKLLDKRLTSNRNSVDLNGIKPGFYIYRIFENGKNVKSEKLVIQ